MAPHYPAKQLVVRDVGDFAGAGDAPVLQDRHPVGEEMDLLQAVGDVDDGGAASGDRPHAVEEKVDRVFAERGRGLVEDEDRG